MGLKLLLVVALLVCETISLDFARAGPNGTPEDDDGTGDVTEGSGDSDIPASLLPEIPLNAGNFTPGIAICHRSRHGFNPNITNEQLNAEPTGPCNETYTRGGAAGLIFSHSVLVPYFVTIIVSNFY